VLPDDASHRPGTVHGHAALHLKLRRTQSHCTKLPLYGPIVLVARLRAFPLRDPSRRSRYLCYRARKGSHYFSPIAKDAVHGKFHRSLLRLDHSLRGS
jgi:hypothetical protein